MADSKRTRAQLLALLVDNSTGEISPQDMRDLVVSLFGVYGSIKAVDNAVVQAMTAATPAKVTNYTKNGLAVGTTPDYANNQIALPNGGTYLLYAQASIKSSVADVALNGRLAIDGSAIDGRFDMELVNADEVASGLCLDVIAITAAQVLSLRIETDKITNLTMTNGQLMACRIG